MGWARKVFDGALTPYRYFTSEYSIFECFAVRHLAVQEALQMT